MSGQSAIMNFDRLVHKEVVLVGAFSHDISSVIPAIRLVESRKYPVEKIITHVLPLHEVQYAMELANRDVKGEDPIRVALVPS
jgi:threonine dehydrogenase-like Zn-dependent dehydrogenase